MIVITEEEPLVNYTEKIEVGKTAHKHNLIAKPVIDTHSEKLTLDCKL
jgi:hypothetical protein